MADPEVPVPSPRLPSALSLALLALLAPGCGPSGTQAPPGGGAPAAYRPADPGFVPAELEFGLDELIPPPGTGTARLHGVVVDAAGAPVAGATVSLLAMPLADIAEVPRLHAATTTGPDGRFEVGPGPSPWRELGVLSVTAPGYARTDLRSRSVSPPDMLSADEGEAVKVILPRGVRVTGLVRPADGMPPDGPVTLCALSQPNFTEFVTTDPEGVFSLTAPEGRVLFRVLDGRHHGVERTLEVGKDGGGRIEIPIQRGRDLSGQVVDAVSGAPVPGAALRAYYGRTRVVVADREGRFLLPHYWFRAFQAVAPGYVCRQNDLPAPEVRSAGDPLVVRLDRGFSASGRVEDMEGKPLPGIRLRTFYRDATGVWQDFPGSISRADGTFVMAGLPLLEAPGETRIFTVARGRSMAASPALRSAAGGAVEGLVLRVPRLVALKGVVEDEKEVPTPAAIRVSWDPGAGLKPFADKIPHAIDTTAGPDGTWEAVAPEGTTVRVEAEGESFETARAEAQVPLGGPPAPLTVRVLRGLSIRGRVVDAEGKPVDRGEVRVEPQPLTDPRPSRDGRVRLDGEFEIGGLVPGTYGVAVLVHPEFLQQVVRDVPAGGDPVRVVLRRAGWVRGRVLLPRGAAGDLEAQVTLRALEETHPLPPLLLVRVRVPRVRALETDGAFDLGPLSPGRYSLSVEAEDWRLDRAEVVVPEGAPPERERRFLDLGDLVLGPGAAVAGTVLLGDRPAPGAPLELMACEEGRFSIVRRIAAGADGSFRVSGLRSGPYLLYVRLPQRPALEVTFEAKEGEEVRPAVVVPRGGTLSVKVLRADGSPASGTRVLLADAKGSLEFWKEGSEQAGPHRTGVDGVLRCTGVAAGRVRVVATLPGIGTGEGEAEVPEGGEAAVEVRLPER